MKDLLTLPMPYLSSLFLRRLCFSCDKKVSQITQDFKKGNTRNTYICYIERFIVDLSADNIYILLPERKTRRRSKKYRDGRRRKNK